MNYANDFEVHAYSKYVNFFQWIKENVSMKLVFLWREGGGGVEGIKGRMELNHADRL